MIRKIKALGLAFVAVLAMSSVVASAAHAVEREKLHVDAVPAVLTGQNVFNGVTHVHTLFAAKTQVQCQEATLEGTTTEETPSDVQVTATYEGCKAFGVKAVVQMNGCKYTLTGAEQGTGHPTTAEAEVVGCTPNKQIQVVTSVCTVNVPEQGKYLPHVVFTNNTAQVTAEKDVVANATVGSQTEGSGVKYQEVGATCPDGNNVQKQNGEFKGETTLKAFVDGAEEQVKDMEHQFTRHKCGAQVGLFAD